MFAFVALLGGGAWLWFRLQSDAPTKSAALDLPEERQAPQQVVLPQVPFTDVTETAGIRFRHDNGARGEKLLPETMGAGCAFLDFDGDGDQDILLINARDWPWSSPADQPASQLALYANDGAGNFQDVSEGSGLDVSLYGTGVAVGDYDADGRVDGRAKPRKPWRRVRT